VTPTKERDAMNEDRAILKGILGRDKKSREKKNNCPRNTCFLHVGFQRGGLAVSKEEEKGKQTCKIDLRFFMFR